ncbi:MAG: carboxypeptidase-like regulatory domain-containing protein [Bacteroidetes bacterium]|nr:MAG: carboxypeptidase-like regulatory domain-containing protein [Bacteroidota bacterium]
MTKSIFLSLTGCLFCLLVHSQPAQTIKGIVIDEVSKAPLAGASVTYIVNGQSIGTVTGADGSFKLTAVPTGRVALKISILNYEEQTLPNVIVTAGKEVSLAIGLTEKIAALANVVVRGQNNRNRLNNASAVVSARSFNIEDTKRYAGALGDPSRMAANFAGVSGANDSRNDIVVRGNAPSGLLWQMEGLNIPNPNHFGSLSSST